MTNKKRRNIYAKILRQNCLNMTWIESKVYTQRLLKDYLCGDYDSVSEYGVLLAFANELCFCYGAKGRELREKFGIEDISPEIHVDRFRYAKTGKVVETDYRDGFNYYPLDTSNYQWEE